MNKLRSLARATWLSWFWSVKSLIIIIVLGLAGFFALPSALRKIDPESAPIDPGVLTFIPMGWLFVFSIVVAFWILMRSEAPVIDQWFDGDLEKDTTLPKEERVSFRKDWLTTTPAVRLGIFTALFLGVLITGAIVVLAAF